MKTKVAAFVVISMLTLVMPDPSLAQGPGWVYNLKVIRIVNTSNGGFNIRFSPDLTGCVSQSGYGAIFASIYPNHPGINRMKADFLVAYTTGDVVSVYLGDANCMVTEMFLGAG
jgi:hypothetical protein